MKRISFLICLSLILPLTVNAQPWYGKPQVVGAGAGGDQISGVVFNDLNQNGLLDRGEPGVGDVLVSNGLNWTSTDESGRYEIGVREDMNLTIVQPSGWRVPTDQRMVPQFFYIHKEGGTGYDMRFGGLPDTGPAPSEINFPLHRDGAAGEEFTCAVLGDTQTYSNEQVSWLRDGALSDILDNGLKPGDCMLYLGDVVGDDLGLLDRILELGSVNNVPQWMVLGNHDIDFDARTNADKADSWRRIYGPDYYAFEMGNVLFVVLDNVYYPCGEEDVAMGRTHCGQGRSTYNGRLTETQFQWLDELVQRTPEDRLIVVNTHIPLISFADGTSGQHQTDELHRLHAILENHEALSFSGHTHTMENHSPGQLFNGWTEQTGIGPLPFRHIIAGAASGAWYQGDFTVEGVPMALMRLGAPMGYLHVEFTGADYRERYVGAGVDPERGHWIGVNTPAFRQWFNRIIEWNRSSAENRNPIPPYSINDLPDTKIVTPGDIEEGVWLTVNVWAGSAETEVKAILPGDQRLTMERTQSGEGESPKTGAQWADPFAAARQLSVARYAYESTMGPERAQGQELFRGSNMGPAAPRPQSSIALSNMHLWRVQLPELPLGVHPIEVVITDRHGEVSTDRITIEVRESHPPRYWRNELWD
ncbi:calcineurin-like phosphoesterase C-terminal domain-containing protein [Rhodohalobacter mucosus]|uniref:Metallophosphoesterase n=1 Tax=Rhodohalobacter mucosus TaxID=2079485 RepID=A0A316U245_9BACT|nr:calcineurin-like phosphoesterase family protein [Rhodohalobacter mucosus]PWN07186.1 metallophosphoesterase [Rhodohalobacter mucosus]